MAQNINVAQTQFWGVTAERQLGHKNMISIEYNGAHGVHLYDIANVNEVGGGQFYLGDSRTIAGLSCSPTCWTRPNMQFTSINNRGSHGFSHYNALNVRFQSQEIMQTGLSVLTNYTWAHSLDNLSSTFCGKQRKLKRSWKPGLPRFQQSSAGLRELGLRYPQPAGSFPSMEHPLVQGW